MTYKTISTIKCLVCVGFGPALLFFPEQVFTQLGAAFGTAGAIASREYGAALIGNVFLTWISRNAEPSSSRTAIIIALFVYDAVGMVAMTILQLQGYMNPLGWGVVAIYLFFMLTYSYLLLKERQPSGTAVA